MECRYCGWRSICARWVWLATRLRVCEFCLTRPGGPLSRALGYAAAALVGVIVALSAVTL